MTNFLPALLIAAQAAPATSTCVVTQYELPPALAEAFRPYAVCKSLSTFPSSINGANVTIGGSGFGDCATIRENARASANKSLAVDMPDAHKRRTYIDAELDKIDQFSKALSPGGGLLVGPPGGKQPNDGSARPIC